MAYKGGCIIAEWVNDGGIESVEFEHTIAIPVTYQWNASHDYPTLLPLSEPSGERLSGECPTHHTSASGDKWVNTSWSSRPVFHCPDCGAPLDDTKGETE